MKMMQGACFLAVSNMSRTRLAPTPTNISTKSEPEIEKNGTLASPAMARASSVLPVPGGPTISTPRGILPPSFWKRPGSRRNSTSSPTSSLASSQPATSARVTLTSFSPCSLARDLPKLIAPLPPPCCICRIMKNQKPMISATGSRLNRMLSSSERGWGFSWVISTLFSNRVSSRRESSGAAVVNTELSVRLPVTEIWSSAMFTSDTRPLFTSSMNWL